MRLGIKNAAMLYSGPLLQALLGSEPSRKKKGDGGGCHTRAQHVIIKWKQAGREIGAGPGHKNKKTRKIKKRKETEVTGSGEITWARPS